MQGVDVAAASQGTNLNVEKVNLAVRQSLGYWSAVTPLEFQAPLAGETPLLRIFLDSDGSPTIEPLGTTGGFISSTPHGPSGDVRAFDALTGKLIWRFHTVPKPAEFGNDSFTTHHAAKESGRSLTKSVLSSAFPGDEMAGVDHVSLANLKSFSMNGSERRHQQQSLSLDH